MSVIASFSVHANDFTLGKTISGNPGTRIQLDRVIPIGDTFIPYFWATDETVDAIEDRLSAEADIASFEVVEVMNGEALVRVEWEEQVDGLLEAMAETGASILEGVGEHDVWRLRLRFDDHDRLSEFFRRCAEKRISMELETVHNPGVHQAIDLESKLTDAQREALELALREGYFDVPRRINLVDMAEELGLSDSAISQRIRRGIATVLRDTAIESEPTEEE